MRTPVKRTLMRTLNSALVISLAIVALSSLQAHSDGDADGSESSFDDIWLSGLAVTTGFTIQEQRSTVESFEVLDPPQEFRPADTGEQWAVTPYVGVNLEVMTPAYDWLPRKSRVFLSVGVLPTFAADRDIATEGDASGFVLPLDKEGRTLGTFDNAGIRGRGSKTTSTLRTPMYSADLGIAFPFEISGYRMRVKPSFGWIWYEVEVKGLLLESQKPFPAFPVIRYIKLDNSQRQGFPGIGPGLEIEMDVARYGDLLTSIFVGGNIYRILGDRSVDMSDATTHADFFGTNTYTANWTFDVDPWLYNAGLGLRVRWLGW
jgi:hypothetical protein